ncbi:MAG: phosphodiester glycosidase family protein [Ruminococcus sp.]|nr:phosphodiester glycosidase family protein [Ruminococcus sp.]
MPEKNKKHKRLFAGVYALVLAAFTGYVMLDTFTLPTVEIEDATGENTTMFEGLEVKKLTGSESESVQNGDDTTDDNSSEAERSGGFTKPSKGSGRGRRSSSDTNGSAGKKRSSDNTATDTTEDTTDSDSSSSTSADPVSAGSYNDDNISVNITEYYQNSTKIYVADVKLSSAQYLKTAFANGSFGKNITQTTSDIADDNNAILAINGDYYGARETGCVIRNGIVYRDTATSEQQVLCVYADGGFDIISGDEADADTLVENGVWQAFTFGPGLVDGGEITVDKNTEVGQAMASNPRTAIGIIDDLHYVLVVSDGRTDESEGLSLYELAQFMQSVGCKSAYNLDGGGSSTMYFQGEIINTPVSHGSSGERKVSDIVYLAK